jgi:hypothetical protein
MPVIPATQEGVIWRIAVQYSPGKKLDLILTHKLDLVECTCGPRYVGGPRKEDCSLRLPWEKSKTLPEK